MNHKAHKHLTHKQTKTEIRNSIKHIAKAIVDAKEKKS
jgi:hypothetical protein